MRRILLCLSFVAVLLMVGADSVMAQRGRGGGAAGGGRAGMTRPAARPGGGGGGGGVNRPSARSAARPSMPSRPGGGGGGGMTRPSARPGGPAQSGGGMARPNLPGRPSAPGGGARPNLPGGGAGGNRPNLPGAGARPNLPGNVGATRPNLPGAGARPNLPGNVGATRPNLPGGGARPNLPGGGARPNLPGDVAGGNRPSTRPGDIGGARPNLPGGGARPNLPGDIGGNRPGLPGGGSRPGPGDLTRPGTRPGFPGGGDRPGPGLGDLITRPGRPGGIGGGDRPVTLPGDLTRPGRPGGGDRPGGGLIGGNRPGRPGIGDGNQIGNNVINRPNYGGNVINRPNYGGNNFTNNTSNNNWFGGDTYNFIGGNTTNNWFGGGGWGGGGWNNRWNNGGWNNGGWGGGWNNPYRGYHNNWYRGWDNNYVNINLGMGRWGLGAPAFGFYNTFPTWGLGAYSGWGLGTMATSWMSSSFVNPYYTEPVVVAGAPTTVVYDYSQPINVAAAPPEEAVAQDAVAQFDQARELFQAGDYSSALRLTDAALQQLPNDPTLHEFRGLALFALGRYDEAAAVNYAVLSAGPGWNWSTMAGLYSDTIFYTNQLRALEAYVRENPTSASGQFLLGYHYLVQGHSDAARLRFAEVAQLQPADTLSARFVEALTPPEPEPAPAAVPPPPASARPTADTRVAAAAPDEVDAADVAPDAFEPTPPPANLAGTWTAQPDPTMTIALTLGEDGAFTWEVRPESGDAQTITGQADYQDGGDQGTLLALLQPEGPPLAGKVENAQDSRFDFHLLGGANAPRLTFTR